MAFICVDFAIMRRMWFEFTIVHLRYRTFLVDFITQTAIYGVWRVETRSCEKAMSRGCNGLPAWFSAERFRMLLGMQHNMSCHSLYVRQETNQIAQVRLVMLFDF